MNESTQTTAENVSRSKQPIVFDADAAEQRVPLSLERKGKIYKVAHIFRPPTDDDLVEYERRRNVRMREANKAELGERGMAMQSDSEKAAIWLWDRLAVRLEGYVNADNWREKVSPQDKEYAVTQGLLACEAYSPEAESAGAEDLLDFDDDGELIATVELSCFAGEDQLTTLHTLRAPSAADLKQYKDLMRTSYTVRGRRLNKADIRVPSKAKPLANLYDRLVERVEGYAGRVPLHHKMAVILEHLGQEQETLAGN